MAGVASTATRPSPAYSTAGFSAGSSPSTDSESCSRLSLIHIYLILADAGLTNAQWNPAAPHLSAGLCGELARDAGAEALILTHLRPGNDPETLLSQAQAAFPGAQLAKAGSRYVI